MVPRPSVVAIALLLGVSIPAAAQQQADAPKLEFEVATVKPSAPGGRGGGIKPMPGGQTYEASGVPVKLMIRLMFHLNDSQISGGPDWLNSDPYDVQAKADAPHSLEELHVMFQNLLIDRFKLQFHWDTRTLPMYALVVDKSGSKMKADPNPQTYDHFSIEPGGLFTFRGNQCSMSYLAWFISQRPQIGRPVVDESGLPGLYDFDLAFLPELPPGVGTDGMINGQPIPALPDLTTALREQLGLRLESRKGPVQVMVIDHVEKPTAADN
jgi:uncharacterized protein (TIGR03435 family)